MNSALLKALAAMRHWLRRLFSRTQPSTQVAALCLRGRPGRREVLLVSSLGTGRWIIPKGWPMRGRTLAEAALREAWEEAGVKGEVGALPFGAFDYLKQREKTAPTPCEVQVFIVRVTGMEQEFPEAGRRILRWVRPVEAVAMVEEPRLKVLLGGL
ncbi:NUDIX hydrolase [Phaeovulum sp.]|uniref:NUDIX hydrolase n=1 Tax=Phaeovulum sp. TaxID=2934796 RepID=UPI00356A1EF1